MARILKGIDKVETTAGTVVDLDNISASGGNKIMTIAVSGTQANYYFGSNITFNVNTTTALSGVTVTDISYSIDGSTPVSFATSATGSFTFQQNTASSDQNHTEIKEVIISVTDSLGNTASKIMNLTFEFNPDLVTEFLVIAGGGGGGAYGGGGGAGGVISGTQTLSSATIGTNYTITVGGPGGGGGGGYDSAGSAGGPSSAFGLTALGGGRGGSGNSAPQSGGSGGGAGYVGQDGGDGTVGQGNNGGGAGGAGSGSPWASSGGGGAGAAGDKYTSNFIAGAGGIGTDQYSDWGLAVSLGEVDNNKAYFGGGGGGGVATGGPYPAGGVKGDGGIGGGGSGSVGGGATSGQANTGGGGGGSGMPSLSGAGGGAGLVIVRYAGQQVATGGDIIVNSGGYTYHAFTQSGTFTY